MKESDESDWKIDNGICISLHFGEACILVPGNHSNCPKKGLVLEEGTNEPLFVPFPDTTSEKGFHIDLTENILDFFRLRWYRNSGEAMWFSFTKRTGLVFVVRIGGNEHIVLVDIYSFLLSRANRGMSDIETIHDEGGRREKYYFGKPFYCLRDKMFDVDD